MRRLLTRTLLATTAAFAAVILAASSASAETFTGTGANADGHNHGISGTSTLTLNHNGSLVQLTCDSSEVTSSGLFDGTTDGTSLFHIIDITFTNCRLGTITFSVTCNTRDVWWDFNAESKDGAGRTFGHIAGNIVCHIHGTNIGCEIDVVGTSVGGFFDNADDTFHIPGGDPTTDDQDLRLTSVTGCLGIVGDGDPASFSAMYFMDDPPGLQIN